MTKREDIKSEKSGSESVDERIAILELESQELVVKTKMCAEETAKTSSIIAKLENDIISLTPYMVRIK